MFHQFDHRWATYSNSGDTRDLTDVEKCDSSFEVKPRYWVNRNEVENKLGDCKKKWLLSFRRTCRATDERTAIFSLVPQVGLGDSVFIMIPTLDNASLVSCLQASLNSLVFYFITRQKAGGANFSFFIAKQLPVITPEAYTQEGIKFISDRVLELVYTAWICNPSLKIWDMTENPLFGIPIDAHY